MFGTKPNREAPNARCAVHGFAHAAARCRACGDAYCDECLVYPFGERRPPYCVRCGLVAAGIRRR
jgi:hypothetical protein